MNRTRHLHDRKRASWRHGFALVLLLAGLAPFVASVAPASANSWTLTLTSNKTSLWPTQYATITATVNMDIAQSGGVLHIYEDALGSKTSLTTCYSGTACSVAVTQPQTAERSYEATLTDRSGNTLVTSASLIYVYWMPIQVSLAASPTTLAVGASSMLTATTSADIGPTPFFTEIIDTTTAKLVTSCYKGTSCSASVSQATSATHAFRAYVSSSSTAYPPPGVQATSGMSFVTWSFTGWAVSLSTTGQTYNATLTATANGNVGPTPYYIEIFDENGTRLTYCGTGVTCSLAYFVPAAGAKVVAFVSSSSTALPPAGTLASSNVLNFGSYKP